MDKKLREYLAQIGTRGGQARSASKGQAARKNGMLGGRPRRFQEITAYETMRKTLLGDDWKITFMDFVDGFRRHPSLELVRQDPVLLNGDPKMYALLQSICIQLCLDSGLTPKGWLVKKAFLTEPWFVSGIKKLYAMALKESPAVFRKNNIFVLQNFLNRA